MMKLFQIDELRHSAKIHASLRGVVPRLEFAGGTRVANALLARAELGWRPTVDFRSLVRMMVEADLAAIAPLQSGVRYSSGPVPSP
jgi:nucleoside-diphosphate-sugar epimerase